MKLHIEGATPEQAAQMEKYAKLALNDQSVEVTMGSVKQTAQQQGGINVCPIHGTKFYVGQVVVQKTNPDYRYVIVGHSEGKKIPHLSIVQLNYSAQSIGTGTGYAPQVPASEYDAVAETEFARPAAWNW